MTNTLQRALPARLRDALGTEPDCAWWAPGRANLMGDHTDYNGGFALPVGLELGTHIAGWHAPDAKLRLRSRDADGEAAVDLRSGAGPEEGWGSYARAVVRSLLAASVPLSGFVGVVASTIPLGGGLASSAALEVAVALAVSKKPLDPLRVARLCRDAENEHVGLRSGLLDQLACAASVEGHALLIDFKDDSYRAVAWPEDLDIVVIDSGIPRALDSSGYNERRNECARACEALGVSSLRDVDEAALAGADLGPVAVRRARHVVTENERVGAVAAALEAGDAAGLGAIFATSHASLATDYEVSTPELDALVDTAVRTPGVVAARMTGGGFGGCTVNLVTAGCGREAGTAITRAYREVSGLPARFWVSAPAGGAREVA